MIDRLLLRAYIWLQRRFLAAIPQDLEYGDLVSIPGREGMFFVLDVNYDAGCLAACHVEAADVAQAHSLRGVRRLPNVPVNQ